MLMSSRIFDTIEEALKGANQIQIIFKEKNIEKLYNILVMSLTNVISLTPDEQEKIEDVAKNRTWGTDLNRIITFKPTDLLQISHYRKLFVTSLYQAIEGIQVVSQS